MLVINDEIKKIEHACEQQLAIANKEFVMKRYSIFICFIFLLFTVSIKSMEQQTYESREWNAEDYAQGNDFQEVMSLKCLEITKIDITDKVIVDACCGTGNIAEKMAQKKAKHVYGFDASKNMIDYAQRHYSYMTNLSFEHSFAEKFVLSIKSDLVVAFFCLHWIEDKKTVFKNWYDTLKVGGELLFTLNKQSMLFETFCRMFQGENSRQITGRSNITDEQVKLILQELGFTIVSYQQIPQFYVFKDEKAVVDFQRPLFMSRPIIQSRPEADREALFNDFMKMYIEKLVKTDQGYRFSDNATLTIVHCRK